MRKYHQRKILELLDTIKYAQEQGLYSDCQEGALAIGEYIESLEGTGTKTVSILEQYYEELYRVSIGKSGVLQLMRFLDLINQSVAEEFASDRIEVAFLPYKRAMSDSLESIWRAAMEDPDCDAYIIPIPYYERNTDGSVGVLRCETDLYPENLPVTDYRQYDIQSQHPDIIFIHYPYDDGNYATALHPDYFSKRLRECTDLLIYVPYYASAGDTDENLCMTPAALYADRIILQSEMVRDTYIKVYKEFEAEKGIANAFGNPEEKFIALGSPKFDAVLNAKATDYPPLPDAWQKIIGEKRVVLYNTTVASLIKENGKQYLKKIKETINFFRKYDDTVLWWRPHPLNEAVCQAMRPELLEDYTKIVNEFIEAGCGIYDDTAESIRAIIHSDAYYGDMSGLLASYGLTGKPAAIQVPEIMPQETWDDLFTFETFADTGDEIYISAFFWNALIKIDKSTWRAEYIGSFPDEEPAGIRLHRDAVVLDGKIYFAPFAAAAIGVYDIANGSIQSITVPEPNPVLTESDVLTYKFISCAVLGSEIWFFPALYPGIVRYDTKCGAFNIIDSWLDDSEKYRLDAFGHFGSCKVSRYNEKFYLPLLSASAIMIYDIVSASVTFEEIGTDDYFMSSQMVGNDLWLIPFQQEKEDVHITRFNMETHQTERIRVDGELKPMYYRTIPFYAITESGGRLWCMPGGLDHAISIDPLSADIRTEDQFTQELAVDTVPIFPYTIGFLNAWSCDGSVYAFGARSRTITEYNTNSGEGSVHRIIPPENIEEIYGERFNERFSIRYDNMSEPTRIYHLDSVIFGPRQYLNLEFSGQHDYERQKEYTAREYGAVDGNAGERIYKYSKHALKKGMEP